MNLNIDTILNIIGIGIAILTPTIGAWITWHNRYHYSWKKILKAVHTLHERLSERGEEPNLILAFAKGGLIVADLLNMQYDNRIPIITIYTKRSLKAGQRLVEIDTSYVNFNNLKGKKIFLVDDVVQSGSSLQSLVKLLTENYSVKRKDITTIVLATNISVTQFQPDVFVYEFAYSKKRPILPWGQVPRD